MYKLHYNLFLFLILISILFVQSSNGQTKQGGVCFRIDDNHTIAEYLEYEAIFKKYNQHFTFALNLDLPNIDQNYVKGANQMIADGNEFMDHTPVHATNLITTQLSPDIYINRPGVESITGNLIKLKFAEPDISKAKRSGYVDINGNIITSKDGIFSSFSKLDCYLYFPELNKLVLVNDYGLGWIDANTVKVEDVWNGSVNLGTHQNVQFYNFDNDNIHLTKDAIRILAQESLRLSDYLGLSKKPTTWIQPGGYFPRLWREEIKEIMATEFGYKAAGVFANPSLKIFNEYNPNDDEQFGLDWGNFLENTTTLENLKKFIANRIAKHRVLIGLSHFSGSFDGWSGYLQRMDGLVKWCVDNQIPIRTYTEWSDILYNQLPNANENIFPNLNVDRDGDNYPDGYSKVFIDKDKGQVVLDAQWIKNDGVSVSDNYSFQTNKVGDICYVGKDNWWDTDGLAGLEKGNNEFEIWTKGAPGNFIEVDFKVSSSHYIYKFPAESSTWTKYNLSQSLNGNTNLLWIPNYTNYIEVTVRCSQYSSGTVSISGMQMAKSLTNPNYLTVNTSVISLPSNSGTVNFSIGSNVDWNISKNVDWLSVSPASGSNSQNVTVTYSENTLTENRSGIITINYGNQSIDITINQSSANAFINLPIDSLIIGSDTSTQFINIESNTNWKIKKNSDWLLVSPDSGFGNINVKFTVQDNPDSNMRSSLIEISNASISKQISFFQTGKDVFNISALCDSLNCGAVEGNGRYIKGSLVKLIAIPNIGYKFENWTEKDSVVSRDTIYTFTAASNRKIYVNFTKIMTGINDFQNVPNEFALFQNYPNPFNPTTTIKYSIPNRTIANFSASTNVQLTVFDILGHEIRNLVNEQILPGTYEINFDASNLSSGIYYYQIKAGNFVQTKKMILMK